MLPVRLSTRLLVARKSLESKKKKKKKNPIFTWKYYQGHYSGHITSSLWWIDEYMRALGDEERIRTRSKVVPKIEKLA